jgi:hypothetical protein
MSTLQTAVSIFKTIYYLPVIQQLYQNMKFSDLKG